MQPLKRCLIPASHLNDFSKGGNLRRKHIETLFWVAQRFTAAINTVSFRRL
jgi:hypothetical protein